MLTDSVLLGPVTHPNANLYVLVAGITVSVYDYLLTLKQEISYVWSCPRSLGLALFYIGRYLTFIDQTFILYVQFATATPSKCSTLSSLSIVLMMVGFMSSQAIISLRTCAMWGRQRWVLVVLGILTTLTIVLSLYTMASAARTMISANRRFAPVCQEPPTGKFDVAWFCLVTVTETIIVLLTITKAYQHLQHSSADWLNQLYRNGIFYSICVLLLSITNLLFFTLVISPQYQMLFVFPTRVAHSIIGNRVMLLLVEHRYQTLRQSLRATPSTPEFEYHTNMDGFLTTFDVDQGLADEQNSRPGTLEVEWIA